MKRAKCPCCGAEVRSNEKTEAWARRWRCEPCGAPGTVSYDSQRCQARGASGAAALEGAGSFTCLPSTSCARTCYARPAGGRSTVRSRARSGRTSGWAARTPRTRLRLGRPFLPCRPMTISTRSTGPARHHPSAGATGPYGGAESQKSIPFGYTEKHALCSIRLHYADVYYWMSFT